MARRKSLLQLLDELEPQVRKAYEDSIRRVTSGITTSRIEAAIARGDIDAVLRILNPEPAHFAPLLQALEQAYYSAGELTLSALAAAGRAQGAQVRGFFNPKNPEATRWIENQSSRLVTGPSGSIEEIRNSVRRVLSKGMEEGTSPRTAALNLVGRVNAATGSREGGVIGLADNQINWVNSALEELTSGNKDQLSKYLNRKLRDRRFDDLIKRAIDSGEPIDLSTARKIVSKYKNRILKYRGEVIARTELLQSLHSAQDEGLRQMIEREGIPNDAAKRIWDSAEDSATRDSHRAMDGQVRFLGEAFITGNGHSLPRPGDSSLGAPASEVIQCRCVLKLDVDFTSILSRVS